MLVSCALSESSGGAPPPDRSDLPPEPRLDLDRHAGLVLAALASVTIHGALLGTLYLLPGDSPGKQGGPISARLLDPAHSSQPASSALAEQIPQAQPPQTGAPESPQQQSDNPPRDSAETDGLADLRLLPGPDYLAPSELTERPLLIGEVTVELPPDAPGFLQGRILLVLLVNSGGTVDKVIVEESPFGGDITDAAVRSFARAVYAPGRLNGVAVNTRIPIEITYHPALPADRAVISVAPSAQVPAAAEKTPLR